MSIAEGPPDVQLRGGTSGSLDTTIRSVDGRDVVVFELDGADVLASLTSADGHGIESACRMAVDKQLPLVGYLASSGADIREGVAATHGWGRAARALASCSGIVPTVMVVTGPAVSGPALMLGLADHVVMVDESYAFVSGPTMVEQFTGVPIERDELGGAGIHRSRSGVASSVVPDLDAAHDFVRSLLGYLPSNLNELPTPFACDDPIDQPNPDLREIVPVSATGSYDVRSVIAGIVDDAEVLELHAGWADNLVTAFAAVDGMPVGIVANQPQVLAGSLDIAASQKGARFVALCDAFNLPLITLVDTSGFMPGKDLEWRGMIRHGAQLAFAYARATVPRISLTLRKSYGGAYIVMDSKYMGNDLALAWPSAEIAVMGAKGAIEILHRREDEETRLQLEAEYEERLLNPFRAAERGSVDIVIDPADSRPEIASALRALSTKQERLPRRTHDNTPL